MTNLTIRIDEILKEKASNQAKNLGIPLSLVIKNALQNFINTSQIVIGKVENVEVDSDLQLKMNKIADILNKK